MATFLRTDQALVELAKITGRPPNDPALVTLFDQLVLRRHLKPFDLAPGWWELARWKRAERFAAKWQEAETSKT